jgi:tetratricopeptide (TPR) repeat protein
VITFCLVASVAAQDPAGDDDDRFARGRDALFRGQYQRAIELFGQLVEADPEGTDLRARLHLAKALRYAGKSGEAEPILREVLAAAPDHVDAGRALAEILAAGERWKELLETLEPLLKYRHDYPTYHLLAEAAYHLDDRVRARRFYKRAVELNPQSGLDHYRLGNLYLADSAFAAAAESLRTAWERGIESPLLHYKLATAYFNLRSYFGKLEVVAVKSGEVGEIQDRHYLVEPVPGRRDEFLAAPPASAAYQIAKAIEAGLGDRPDVRMLRANVYLNAGRFRRAHELFAELAADVPEEDRALFLYYYAQAAFGIGDYEAYLERLREAIRLDSEAYGSALVLAYVRVAEQHDRAGDLERYIEYLRKAVAESPQTASLHRQLGDALAEAQRHGEAVVQWRMVLDLEPDHPDRTELIGLIEKHRARSG